VFTCFGRGDILLLIKWFIKPINEDIQSCRFNSSNSITWEDTSSSISWNENNVYKRTLMSEIQMMIFEASGAKFYGRRNHTPPP
jgi:hypothetical protein